MKLSWLQHPHEAEILADGNLPDEGDVTAAMIFVFKGHDILLAQVFSRGWSLPGGHKERGETMEEAVTRELFEECGTDPLVMGPLGSLKIKILTEKRPRDYMYPFPFSSIAFFWGVVEDLGTPSASMEVGIPKFFTPDEARQLDTIRDHLPLYNAALERAKVVAGAMGE
jgi:8-oxo-dGTP pyrophosphatase MutT (NUDIX family)